MIRGFLENSSPFLKFLFFLFVTLFSFFAVFLLGITIAVMIWDSNIFSILTNPTFSENQISALKFLQSVQTVALFLVPSFLLAFCVDKKPFSFLKIDKKPNIRSIILILIAFFVSFPIINFLVELNSKLHLPESLKHFEEWMKNSELNAQKITDSFLKADSFSEMLVNLLIIAVLPAICEELFFRGILQKIFTQWTNNLHFGIFITAILFSALHLQFYGFIPRMLLGIYFGYLLIWSQTLWLPIISHFINNGVSVILFYFFQNQNLENQADTIGTSSQWYISVMAAILFGFLCLQIYRNEKNLKM